MLFQKLIHPEKIDFCQIIFFSYKSIHNSFNPKMPLLRLTFSLSWFTLIACMSDKTKCLSISISQDKYSIYTVYGWVCVCLYVWVEGFQGIAYLLAAFVVIEERLRRRPSVVFFPPYQTEKKGSVAQLFVTG